MRVLILGASGFVGSYLFNLGKKKGDEVLGTYFDKELAGMSFLDLRDKKAVKATIQNVKPEVVFLPAGIPFVDWCEEHPQESKEVNVGGVGNVVSALKSRPAHLVFFSTEYVFGDKPGPYNEEDKPGPLNVYGKQKWQAEKLVSLVDGLILRTVVVYGNEVAGKNFAEQVIRNLCQEQQFRGAIDQVSTPTYVADLAKISYELAEKEVRGVVHVAGSDLMSRYDFALKVAQVFALNKDLILPVESSDLRQKAKRPLQAGLVTKKVTKILGSKPLSVKMGLKRMKQERDD